ncbi:MAG: sialidase family protein, partial [Akkermansiaceae bacterium]
TGQVVIVKSEDDGKTWSKPHNLTPDIKDPAWQLMLQGPGAGITTSDGTLVFAFQYKVNIGSKAKPKYSARSALLYSKDHGKTWKVSPGVDYPQETTEAQVVELNDGSLMLNCRISAGGRAVFTTKNLGKTWKQHPTSGRGTFNMTGCMASILRYSSTKNGDKQNILLFSGPADGGKKRRSHMSIRYSLDEGKTWSQPYLLDQLGGAYSCLTLIDNGAGKPKDIGIIYEGSQSNMTFERLTINELMKEK